MSMNLMAQAMSIKVGNPLRKLVLIKIADNANDEGECWPSYQHIADHCECSKSAVKAHITALIKMGLLSKENRLGVNNGKGNTSNIYQLTLGNPVSSENTAPMSRKSTAPVPSKNTGGSRESTGVSSEKTKTLLVRSLRNPTNQAMRSFYLGTLRRWYSVPRKKSGAARKT